MEIIKVILANFLKIIKQILMNLIFHGIVAPVKTLEI